MKAFVRTLTHICCLYVGLNSARPAVHAAVDGGMSPGTETGTRDGNRDGTETGTGTVLTAIHRSGNNRCYAKNSESSTGGIIFQRPQ